MDPLPSHLAFTSGPQCVTRVTLVHLVLLFYILSPVLMHGQDIAVCDTLSRINI